MSFAGAEPAEINGFPLVRAIGVKLASKIPPGVCNAGKMEAYECFPLPSGRPSEISRFDGRRRTLSSQINKILVL
jgi:hypothetical protein